MRRQLLPAIVSMVVFTVVLGIAFPLVVTGIAQVAFNDKADGSLVTKDGKVIGSSMLAQPFTTANGTPIKRYFQPRPSAANYDPTASSGSNLGPTNPKLLRAVRRRTSAYRVLNGLSQDVKVPVDAVTASASGLDPDISPAFARLQEAAVAAARGITVAQVDALVHRYTNGRDLGFLGEPRVAVLQLNLALDENYPYHGH